jgi:predicted nucleic acid-binding protein
MTVFLPDSSVLIDTLKNKQDRVSMLRSLVAAGHSLACCAITVGEIYSGMRASEAAFTEQFVSTLVWLDTSFSVARKAGELRNEWARKGKTLSLAWGE